MSRIRSLITMLVLSLFVQSSRAADELDRLDLKQARELALTTHPRITIAQLRVLTAKEDVVINRAGYLPQISGNAMAAGVGETNTRLGSGSFTSSQVYDHVGLGLNATQLIMDFGRTANLVEAAKLRAKSAGADLLATRAQLILEVDAAYYAALQAISLRAIATRTLDARQTLFDQVQALTTNRLRSTLDLHFAQVGVAEAKLLQDQANQSWQSSLATLSSLIGRPLSEKVDLQANRETLAELPTDVGPLIEEALRYRPELIHASLEKDALHAVARAASDARLPTLAAVGTMGVVPIRDEHFSHDYAAAAVTLNVPLFSGGADRARERQAQLHARSGDAKWDDTTRSVIREVRLAWLDARHAHDQIGLIDSLLENAQETLNLARERYQQGLSSTVELNQAELAEASAEIAQANAGYAYRLRRDALDFQTGILR